MALSVFLFVHAVFTDGYPFYHPVELFCIRFGFSGSLPCCSTKANRVFECRNKRADFKMVPTRKPPLRHARKYFGILHFIVTSSRRQKTRANGRKPAEFSCGPSSSLRTSFVRVKIICAL